MHEAKTPKERIIFATISLMKELGDPSKITIRKIAENAGVGVGLINYHFQTKDKLLGESVRWFLNNEVIGKWEGEAGDTGRDTASVLSGPADFLASYPGISRVSVLYDLTRSDAQDNTAMTFSGLLRVVNRDTAAQTGSRKQELRSAVRVWQWIAALHEAFLRPDRFEEATGLDFFKTEDRSLFVKLLTEEHNGR